MMLTHAECPNFTAKIPFMAFKFENLQVWQDAVEMTGIVHDVTVKFPSSESYVLTPQIKRAADSVALNIAEGSTGQSNPEFVRFLRYALRSAIEVVCCIYIAKRRKIILDEDFNQIYQYANRLVKRIQALQKSLP